MVNKMKKNGHVQYAIMILADGGTFYVTLPVIIIRYSADVSTICIQN